MPGEANTKDFQQEYNGKGGGQPTVSAADRMDGLRWW